MCAYVHATVKVDIFSTNCNIIVIIIFSIIDVMTFTSYNA